MQRNKRIGITGGIGSGKSTVCAIWQAAGAKRIDADAISRNLTAPNGAAIEAIAQHFGKDYIDANNALDRAKMRTLVFSDAKQKMALERILHPLIWQKCEEEALVSDAKVLVFDIPLLAESTFWRKRLEHVVVVDCEPESQIARVIQRSQLMRKEVENIMRSQATRLERLACADSVIYNEGISLLQLKAQVLEIAHQFAL